MIELPFALAEVAGLMAAYETLLGWAGGLIVFSGAIAVIVKAFAPYKKLKQDVADQQAATASVKANITELQETNRALCKAVLSMMDHMITGNCVDNLKRARKVLEEHIIDNK